MMSTELRSEPDGGSSSGPHEGDVARQRERRLYRLPPPSFGNKLRRLGWRMVETTLFGWSPVFMFGWRCFLLRCFGARIIGKARPYPSARIWAPWNLELGPGSCLGPRVTCYAVGRIVLAGQALVSQGAHLCGATHDHRDPTFPLVAGDIHIGAGAWVSADAFVGPGVSIGDQAVVGARAVVMKSVPERAIVVGNPARVVGQR